MYSDNFSVGACASNGQGVLRTVASVFSKKNGDRFGQRTPC